MKINYKLLVKKAIDALDNYYGPDQSLSKRPYVYSAAVLTDKGKIYTASNYVSDSATLTLHAEQAALSHAAAHRDSRIVAIVSAMKEDLKGKEFCHPCGLCKQLIWENSLKSGIPIKVIMANLKGKYIVRSIKDIVPYPWPAK